MSVGSASPTIGKTLMRAEIEEIPHAVARLLERSRSDFERAGSELRRRAPAMVVTIARGSSDHAAAFLKYAIELTAGIPVSSIGPSIRSIYGRELRLDRAVALAISQSGQSPDIVGMAESARSNGAFSIAITNTPDSPLAAACDLAIDLAAGPERSVAATKTFVASIAAGLALLGAWTEDRELLQALERLPDTLRTALSLDWSALGRGLDGRESLYVLGRGPCLAIASEAALKLKETCGLHAEAYSAAEVLHGPSRLVEQGYPVLALVVRDAAENSVAAVAEKLTEQGARAFITSDRALRAEMLPSASGGHFLTAPLALIVAHYCFVEELSRRRGLDPDSPPHLKKVTETI